MLQETQVRGGLKMAPSIGWVGIFSGITQGIIILTFLDYKKLSFLFTIDSGSAGS